ncbi:MAG: DUF1353 domain-containing protein [Terracidiphilus sp.]
MNRRAFFKACGTGIALQVSSLPLATAVTLLGQNTPNSPQRPQSVGDWMATWMGNEKRGASGRLVLSRFVEPMYYLEKPISWVPNDKSGRYPAFTVPKGFVTDLASIPSVFWSILRPDGNYAYAAILHDYLYWTQIRPKDDADNILKLSMQDFHVTPWQVGTIYEAVHRGGQSSWDENKKLKANGESHFLVKFPEDPIVTWEDWKKDRSNFAP